METLQITWSLLRLLSILAVPQLLGALIYYRIQSFSRLLAHVVGFLVTTTSFVYLGWLFFLYLPTKANPDERCGLWLMAAMFMLLAGTAITVLLSVIIQV